MAAGMDTPTYWLDRLSTRELKTSDLHARISYGGKQRWINLGSSNKKEAARRVVAFLKVLQDTDGDWSLARRSIGQATRREQGELTVGVWINAVVSENSNRPTSMRPLGSSNQAISLTALDIQRSLHL